MTDENKKSFLTQRLASQKALLREPYMNEKDAMLSEIFSIFLVYLRQANTSNTAK